MIPAELDGSTQSPGEIDIYRRLKEDPAAADWTVIHSLNVAGHATQIEGEIDFVAIVPGRGVLCIEVKASPRITRRDGLWYYGQRSQGEARSPFDQVGDAMHSLRGTISKFEDLRSVPFFKLVVFPRCAFAAGSVEWEPWELLDQTEYVGHSLAEALLQKLDEAREDLARDAHWFDASSPEPTPEQCENLTRLLRGNFEFHETAEDRARRLESELKHFTDEQVRVIDGLSGNQRLLVTGPAGSGKTLMAIEAARRANAAGRRTLLLCFNRLLGQWLAENCCELQNVTCATFHAHLREMTGATIPGGSQEAQQRFWDVGLPEMAIDVLLEAEDDSLTFDELILDEAQDLLKPVWLDCLDLLLRGGLAAGRWRMFADFDGQDIYTGDGEGNGLELLSEAIGHEIPSYNLRMNCRNTPRVADLPHRLAGLNPDYDDVLRPDNGIKPGWFVYSDASRQRELLAHLLSQLEDEGYRDRDIVVLSTHGPYNCIAGSISQSPWCERLQDYRKTDDEDVVRYSSIQAFKGMEAPVVILTDIEDVEDDEARALLYVGMTRAVERLTMLVSEEAAAAFARALKNR